MNISLEGKVACITGGGSGIGEAIAIKFAEAGASGISITGRRSKPLLRLKEEIEDEFPGTRVQVSSGDITIEQHLADWFSSTVDILGGIDILVNNAGVYRQTPVENFSVDGFERMFGINLKAPLNAIILCRPYLRLRTGGNILNISSVLGSKPSEASFEYGAIKSALNQLTRSLVLDLSKDGIRINAILPAAVDTPIHTSHIQGSEDLESWKKEVGLIHPMGRIGEPGDIANGALYLCSEAASWVTGALLPIDGGYLST